MKGNKPGRSDLLKTRGFTLIELLVVVAIIIVLSSLLFPAIIMVKKRARRSKAITELKAIDIGWRSYLADYKKIPTHASIVDIEQRSVPIQGDFARILQGINDGEDNNPMLKQYVEFRTFNEDGDPVNPWGGAYYVKFDVDYDNLVKKPVFSPDPPYSDIPRPIIAWTENLDVDSADDLYLLTTWKR
jgi:prepilin-type N-terminal cleavage/methylation domain-containing protein